MKKEHPSLLKKCLYASAIIIIVICGFLLYSRFISTSGLIVKEYKVTNEKLTNFHGFKLVHISDVHYGRIINKQEIETLVKKINKLKPDMVVLTGDLIDRDTKLTKKSTEVLITSLSKIESTLGNYAISGNHDYKQKQWETIIEASNFKNLNDSYDTIYNGSNDFVLLSGLSTNTYGEKDINSKLAQTTDFLNSISEKQDTIYKILLMHEPDYITDIKTTYDLVLAGHTHNGQIRLPWIGAIILPPGGEKYYDNYYSLDKTELYISSGVGTSNINFRFLNRPSINFYRLTSK